RLEAVALQQMGVNAGFGLAQLEPARDYRTRKHVPEAVGLLEVFDRSEVHVRQAIERVAPALQAIEQIDGLGERHQRRWNLAQQPVDLAFGKAGALRRACDRLLSRQRAAIELEPV